MTRHERKSSHRAARESEEFPSGELCGEVHVFHRGLQVLIFFLSASFVLV